MREDTIFATMLLADIVPYSISLAAYNAVTLTKISPQWKIFHVGALIWFTALLAQFAKNNMWDRHPAEFKIVSKDILETSAEMQTK